VEGVVILLAVIGAVVVASFLWRTFGSSARVLKTANQFQAASMEAVAAIQQSPPDELRRVRAVAAWEQAQAQVRRLSASEQRIVAETLRDRGFPTGEVCEGITAFIAAVEQEGASLDMDLASMGATAGLNNA
jgi:hypothetical protein